MKKILIAIGIISLLGISPAVFAAPSTAMQIFMGRNTDTRGTGSFRYLPFNSPTIINAVSTTTWGILPISGTLQNMQISVDSAPGGSASWTATLMQSGVATPVTCTIGSAATSCSDTTHTFVASADHIYAIKMQNTGTPVATITRFSIQFVPSTVGTTGLPIGIGSNYVATSQQYTPIVPAASWNVPESVRQNIFPESGTFKNLYLGQPTLNGSTASDVVTLNAQDTATAITCTIGNSSNSCSDLTHTASISDQNLVDFTHVPTNSPTGQEGAGIEFDPTVSGHFDLLAFETGTESSSVTEYLAAVGNSLNTVEGSSTLMADAMTITNMEINDPKPPGVSRTRIFTLRKNGADTAITCTLSGATQTICTSSGSVSYAQGDTIDISDNPSGSTAQGVGVSVGLVAQTSNPSPSVAKLILDWLFLWGW